MSLDEKPYSVRLRDICDVSLPDLDNEICIEFNEETTRIYLSKEDVLKLLERFD